MCHRGTDQDRLLRGKRMSKNKNGKENKKKKVEIRTLMNLASIDTKFYLRILILK